MITGGYPRSVLDYVSFQLQFCCWGGAKDSSSTGLQRPSHTGPSLLIQCHVLSTVQDNGLRIAGPLIDGAYFLFYLLFLRNILVERYRICKKNIICQKLTRKSNITTFFRQISVSQKNRVYFNAFYSCFSRAQWCQKKGLSRHICPFIVFYPNKNLA